LSRRFRGSNHIINQPRAPLAPASALAVWVAVNITIFLVRRSGHAARGRDQFRGFARSLRA
jgi:hypothetical protein